MQDFGHKHGHEDECWPDGENESPLLCSVGSSLGDTTHGWNDEDADQGAFFEGHAAVTGDAVELMATDPAAGAPVDGARVSNQEEPPVQSDTASSQQPQTNPEGPELSVEIIDDRSYMSPDLQRWIFDQLGPYIGSSTSLADTSGSPGALKVYNGNLSYTENAERKLVFSNETELQSKVYIVQKQNPTASKPPVSSFNQPSCVNFPGLLQNIQLIGFDNGVYDVKAPGDKTSRLAYIGAGWSKNNSKRASPHPAEPTGEKKAKTTDQAAAAAMPQHPPALPESQACGAESDQPAHGGTDSKLTDSLLNPANIKVWGFYRVTRVALKTLEVLHQKNRRELAKRPENTLPPSDISAALNIVLPFSNEGVKVKNVLRKLLSKEVLAKMAGVFKDRSDADSALSDEDSRKLQDSLLNIMLDNVANNPWADWVWEEDYVKPSLQVLAEFAYKHKHMPGVQSAEDIDAGKFDAPQHFKVMLMYQELYLRFLHEHAEELARLQSRIQLLEHPHLAVSDGGKALEERTSKHLERWRAQIKNVLTLRADQKEAVEKCLAGNLIINMPTGSGKTLISVKIVDHFLQMCPEQNVVFVVPTCALVRQQARYLRKHSDVAGCTVAELCGQEMDSWDARRWQDCKRNNRVLLGTPEVFRSSLVDNAHLRVTDISLCVFDECHHATGNSPMACMLRDALQSAAMPRQQRPRIVGLTASFCSGKCDKLIAKRHDIEALLDAHMWAPSAEQLALLALPQEKSGVFHCVANWRPPMNSDSLEKWATEAVKRHFAPLSAALAPVKTCDKVAWHAAHVLVELGVDAFIFYLEKGLFPELEATTDRLLALSDLPLAKVAKIKDFQKQLPQIRQRIADSARDLASYAAEAPLDMAALRPRTQKAARLLELLRSINAKEAKKGIVFVKQTALLYPLAHLCRQDKHLVAEVGGTSTMPPTLVNKALDDFRRGAVMLLIATDAAEEGIDVADCSFVVRFSHFGTTKSHIQGSGRGRARDAEFYYFENDGEDEQGKAALLNDVARDEALALSPAMRAAHPESTAASATLNRTEVFYPFQPQGEGMVNLSNATKIVLEYCAAVMRQAISGKDLCRFGEQSKVLQSLHYPTPEGWLKVAKSERDAELNGYFLASAAEVREASRYKNADQKKKDAKCFFYVAAVQLRKKNLIDASNKPTPRAMTYTHDACAGIQKDRKLTFRPKFKSVFKGDVGGVRDGEGAVKNGGDREDDAEFGDRVDEDEDEDEEDETDEEVEDEEGEESAPAGSASPAHPARVRAVVDSSSESLHELHSGISGSPHSSPAAVIAASATSEVNAPAELQMLVDRRKCKMVYDYDKLGEQEFRARVVIIKPEKGREELAWSQVSGSKAKAKHAAAEIGLVHCSLDLACFAAQAPANSSPSAVAATNASNAPMELQILVDRRKCKVQYDYEKLGEQEFRARVVVLVKSEGQECKEELAWAQASGSKAKAKHAAAEIGLRHLSAL